MRKILPTLLLSMGLIVLGTLFVLAGRRAASAERALNDAYLSAIGESAELTQSLSLALEKAVLSRDAAQTASLLASVARDAGDLRRALALLPLEQETAAPAMALVEEVGDQAEALLPELVADGSLTDDARAALSDLLARCSLLAGRMAVARREALAGERAFTVNSEDAAPTATPSTVTQLPTARGLPRTEVNAGQAMAIARDFVGAERVTGLTQAPDLSGPIAAWGVAVQTPDVQLNVYVTRIGGKVLLMSPETASFVPSLTVEQCREAASAFLESRNIPAMENRYYQLYDGLCVLTFVYRQGGVLIYPDRVTVQVRMDTGAVVGLEASSYWQRHTPRRLPAPALTVDEARARLASDAAEQSVQLCLFPEGEQETLCWEFTVVRAGETYLVYIDARNGREVALQKLILLENGVLAA